MYEEVSERLDKSKREHDDFASMVQMGMLTLLIFAATGFYIYYTTWTAV